MLSCQAAAAAAAAPILGCQAAAASKSCSAAGWLLQRGHDGIVGDNVGEEAVGRDDGTCDGEVDHEPRGVNKGCDERRGREAGVQPQLGAGQGQGGAQGVGPQRDNL